jgi:hypothetical protein
MKKIEIYPDGSIYGGEWKNGVFAGEEKHEGLKKILRRNIVSYFEKNTKIYRNPGFQGGQQAFISSASTEITRIMDLLF